MGQWPIIASCPCPPSLPLCSGQSVLSLAVLHPRKLTVYAFTPEGGTGSSAAYYKMSKAYEHGLGVGGLHFTAFNMCHGNFGGVHGACLPPSPHCVW